MADIANSSARRKVDAARVPKASLDILNVDQQTWFILAAMVAAMGEGKVKKKYES